LAPFSALFGLFPFLFAQFLFRLLFGSIPDNAQSLIPPPFFGGHFLFGLDSSFASV